MARLASITLVLSVLIITSCRAQEAPWERNDDFYSGVTSPRPTAAPGDQVKIEEPTTVAVDTKNVDVSDTREMVNADDTTVDEDHSYEPEEQCWLDELEEVCSNPEDLVKVEPIDEILQRHSAKMKREARLIWRGSQGMHDDPIDHLTMKYESSHTMTIEKARKLLVYATESLLKDLNAGEWVHPQLSHGPFTPEDLTVAIRFYNFHAQYVDRRFVQCIKMEDGIVHYRAHNCKGPRACYTRKERYKDALHFVKLDLEMEGQYAEIEDKRNIGEGVTRAIPFDNVLGEER